MSVKLRRLYPAILCVASACVLAASGAAASDPAPTGRKHGPHPDFSGVWHHDFRERGDKEYYPGRIGDVSFMRPWAAKEVQRRFDSLARGVQIPNNTMLCLPTGVPYIVMEAHLLQLLQTDKELIFLGESDHQVRYVHLNASHPDDLVPSWFGDSIGHWEGDTLVVDTVGLNDKSQLDPWGTPHSEALHVVERIRLLNGGKSMEVLTTLDDPLTFYKPWVYSYHFGRATEETIGEYACAENNRDAQ